MSFMHMEKRQKPTPMDEAEISEILKAMESNAGLNTKRGFADALFPDEIVSFTEKHLEYLRRHPKVDPRHYLANLRTMIKIRQP